jgi:YgiT-type zinc finger domain-containing protein
MTLSEDSSRPAQESRQHTAATFPCACCGAGTHEDLVTAAFWGQQGLIVIEAIPARVCEGCGEQFYDDRTAQRIEGIVNGSAAVAKQRITVPVFSLAGAENSKRNGDTTTPR